MHSPNPDIAGAALQIDLGAIAANYRLIAKQVSPARVAGVVKADGYGLGAVPVSAALIATGCRDFFVAQLSEAIALRPTLPADASLYVLNGVQPGAEAICAAIGAIPVLNALHQIERWSALARASGRCLPGVLQVDSGMSRLGMPPAEVSQLLAEPQRLDGIDLRLVMSHLACGDEPDANANVAQLDAFEALTSGFPGVPRSIRVADLKVRANRSSRITGEMNLAADQVMSLTEYMHPRLQEVCDTMPAWLGGPILASPRLRRWLTPLFQRGRHVRTTSLRWFLVLRGLAALRSIRRSTLRYAQEQARIDAWLDVIAKSATNDVALATEIVATQRLLKGYGDTFERGLANFGRVMAAAETLRGQPNAAAHIRMLHEAALSDEKSGALDAALQSIGIAA